MVTPQLPFTYKKAGTSAAKPASERWTVTELNTFLRRCLEQQFRRVWVEGEIRGLQVQPRSGHAYFSLADDRSAIAVFMSATYLRRLSFPLQEGMHVLLHGEASVYEPRGRLQLRARTLEPVGEGALLLALRARVAQLEAEGLTSPDRKRSLPRWPRPVGVVTSKSGAALRDVIRTAVRRDPGTHILLSPTLVQGAGAVKGIVRSLQRLDRAGCEVILLVRGGGSLDDLQAFNEELVARAVAACRTPVVTGIGHETDTTLVDLVSDARASTPTAAAELVVPERAKVERQLGDYLRQLRRALRARLLVAQRDLHQRQLRVRAPLSYVARFSQSLDDAEARLHRCVQRRLWRHHQGLQGLENRLARVRPQARLLERRSELKRLRGRLDDRMDRCLRRQQTALRGLETALSTRWMRRWVASRQNWSRLVRTLDALSPLAVLSRGYAVVSGDNRVVRGVDDVAPGQELIVRVSDGQFRVTVGPMGGTDRMSEAGD